ncbi:MAG: anthranilate phosphoribosyltransferase [Blastocatellia bacterium AA13]|nr:MAG: anthranilate phosphoribosyltransferase [Blastocatellia bacterium AA13]
MITDALKRLIDRGNLTMSEAEAVLEQIMTGQCTDTQIASFLTALRMKGETVEEVTGFARVMRNRATVVAPQSVVRADLTGTGREALIDTCGTGGDVSGSFNVSTATALVVAGAGVRVAKHGNRSASSQCGSADVMEALGVRIDLTPRQIADCIDRVGIGFLHAPHLHASMKHVARARKEMGIRTIFNMLGPLTNPAGAGAQLIGVYAAHLTLLFAEVLRGLGTTRAVIVHGTDGMDEITITGETLVTELRSGEIHSYSVKPEDFGMSRAGIADIRGGDAEQNAGIIREILEGVAGPRRDIVVLNAAAALMASSRAKDLHEGVTMARSVIDDQRAKMKLRQLIEFTSSLEL